MTHPDDNLLTALRAARPDTGDQPPAGSAEATAMLTRILDTPGGPAAVPDPQGPAARPRPTRRRLLATVGPAVAGVAAAVAVAVTSGGAPSGPRPSTVPSASSVRTAVLDAFQQDSGDIMYTVRTFDTPKSNPLTERGWTYPAFAVPGQQVKTRLFSLLNGAPSEDTESVYIQDVAATRLSMKTTQGPSSAEITDVEYGTKTWSRQRSSTVLLGDGLSPALIKAEIASGRFTVAGTGWVRGHRAVQLTWRTAHGPVTTTATLWVDAKTYQPLLGSSAMRMVTDNREQTIYSDRTQYQILAATPANLRLLSPPIPSGFTRTATSPHF
jgi:hypothetical protein